MRLILGRRFDWLLFTLVLLLSAFGVLMIASALSGNVVYASWPWRQAAFLGVGLVLMFLAAAVDYRLLTSVAYPLYIVFLIALIIMMVLLYVTPASALLTGIAPLPLVGIPLVEGGARMLTLAGVLLIIGGIAWSFVNINSLPMIVDLTSAARIGTFTGLYYLFSTLSAIVGPNLNGWAIQVTNNNYNIIMALAPIFFLLALVMMTGVRRGEAQPG